MDIDDRGQRRGRLAARTIDTGQELDAARPGERHVGFVDFVGSTRIETDGHRHGRVLLVLEPARAQGLTAGASIFIPAARDIK